MSATLSSVERQAAYLAISRMLAYPDQRLIDELPVLHVVADSLPTEIGRPLRDYLQAIEANTLLDLQERYVSIFDMKRRCCLYLSYYLNGDTRRRGMALWRFQETYQRAGWAIANGELADYLPMLLEFAASGPDEESIAVSLMHEHHEGLEVLRAALERFNSASYLLVSALLTMLPSLSPQQQATAEALIANGPPTEMVGLEPFSAAPIVIGARP
jgi:nitrate reductase delta subunit